MKYTKEVAKNTVESHNWFIDEFIKTIPQKLGKTQDTLNACDWFKAQTIIKEEHLYEKAMQILEELRNDGHDVKIDMQSYKLLYYGLQ